MHLEINRDPSKAIVELGAVIIAYHGALTAALKALADVKEADDLRWLDELHQNAVRAAKGTIGDQISMEAEASAVRLGFETLDAHFKSFRVELVQNKD
jgi:hypothetical protein